MKMKMQKYKSQREELNINPIQFEDKVKASHISKTNLWFDR